MSRPRSISEIAAITVGDREVRVELAAGQVFIHISPSATCSHCGHEASIFVAQDGWSPCARCYNTMRLYAAQSAEPTTADFSHSNNLRPVPNDPGEKPFAKTFRPTPALSLILARPFLVAEKAVQA